MLILDIFAVKKCDLKYNQSSGHYTKFRCKYFPFAKFKWCIELEYR